MFTRAAAGADELGGRGRQRQRRALRALGEPRARAARGVRRAAGRGLAEEIDTPGEGQIRALVTIAGNPLVSSTPNAERLARALEGARLHGRARHLRQRDDAPRGRHPARRPSRSSSSHYDLALYQLAVATSRNYSPPVFEPPRCRPEWEMLLRLGGHRRGPGRATPTSTRSTRWSIADADPARARATPGSRVAGRDPGELLARARAAPRAGARCSTSCCAPGPTATASAPIRTGSRSPRSSGTRTASTSGRSSRACRTCCARRSGKIELAPEPIVADVARLRGALARERNGGIVLIGRRQLRSNNSWMHNLPALVKGKDRCTLHVHPDDAARLGLADGGRARVRSAAGDGRGAGRGDRRRSCPASCRIPHGWGHDEDGVRLGVAAAHAGVELQRARRRVAASTRCRATPCSTGSRWRWRRLRPSEPIRRRARMKGHGYTLPPRARGGAATGPA